MKSLVFDGDHSIPNTIQDVVRYTASHQFKAWVQQYGTIAAFQQLRILGSQTAVGFLVDLLSPGIISAQGYARLAFALKLGTRLSHTVLERLTTAKHVESVEAGTAALTDIQFNADRGQALEEVRVNETRDVVKYFYWWQLRVIARKEHEIAMQREFCEHVQERSLAHKYLIDAQRRIEETLLDPVLQPRECLSGIELTTRNVSSGGDCAVIQQLQAFPRQEAFPAAWGAVQAETPLFTCELQSQLDDVRFSLAEDLDGWQDVWSFSGYLVEEDTVFLSGGQLAIKDSENLALASGAFHDSFLREEPPLGLVQSLTGYVHQRVFRQLHLLFRR